ncbi:hypothetical protein RJ640_005135 [Escallonia rubra]|uniref:Deacetylase sirtuin-type domain-containing protein n=1 Tax=Escallonia rubra TaxID=112253 RepID=A0AA88S046_9ASTE|nr:hypothetical protein RJ640_005135 [Escallonia rubra]
MGLCSLPFMSWLCGLPIWAWKSAVSDHWHQHKVRAIGRYGFGYSTENSNSNMGGTGTRFHSWALKYVFAFSFVSLVVEDIAFARCSDPNGAYSTGFKPITHQVSVPHKSADIDVSRARRRYWARSYAGWRRFTAAQPGAAHTALASLERSGRISYMITQNVDRLHHRAGSCPLELHGTVYTVGCVDCGFSFPRDLFQDQLKALNPKPRCLASTFGAIKPRCLASAIGAITPRRLAAAAVMG